MEDSDYKVVSRRRRFPAGFALNIMNPTLGIDIALRTFAAALRYDSHRCCKAEFTNNPTGFRQLRTWLKRQGVRTLKVALESTNTYAEALTQWLDDEGHEVYLLNPQRVAAYASSLGQRNKTDPADALTIAVFISTHECTRWAPPSQEQRSLRSLTRTRQQLVQSVTKLRLQLATADAVARPHLQAVIRHLAAQVLKIVAQIRQHLKAHPPLAEQVRRLQTCKGVGLITAATVLAELPTITPDSDPRALSAWCGLTPRRWQSGKTELPARLSRRGNTHLRQALYMPALVAKRHNPLLKAFAARLAANGKRAPAILGALSHKLLRILVGLLRTNTDFNPNHLSQKI